MMKIVDSVRAGANKIMNIDQDLLNSMHPDDPPLLHLYEWEKPSATFGLFVDLDRFITLEGQNRVEFAKRPTGGGLIFHLWDCAFSILVGSGDPNYPHEDALARYRMINEKLVPIINRFIGEDPKLLQKEESPSLDIKRFCMASPTKYDLVVGGRKVVGSAIRAKKNGFLYQGTIALYEPDYFFVESILHDSLRIEVVRRMKASSYYLAEAGDHENIRDRLKKELTKLSF